MKCQVKLIWIGIFNPAGLYLFTVFDKMVYKVQYLSAIITADLKVAPNYSDFNIADITFLVESQNFNEFFKAINQYLSNNQNK